MNEHEHFELAFVNAEPTATTLCYSREHDANDEPAKHRIQHATEYGDRDWQNEERRDASAAQCRFSMVARGRVRQYLCVLRNVQRVGQKPTPELASSSLCARK